MAAQGTENPSEIQCKVTRSKTRRIEYNEKQKQKLFSELIESRLQKALAEKNSVRNENVGVAEEKEIADVEPPRCQKKSENVQKLKRKSRSFSSESVDGRQVLSPDSTEPAELRLQGDNVSKKRKRPAIPKNNKRRKKTQEKKVIREDNPIASPDSSTNVPEDVASSRLEIMLDIANDSAEHCAAKSALISKTSLPVQTLGKIRVRNACELGGASWCSSPVSADSNIVSTVPSTGFCKRKGKKFQTAVHLQNLAEMSTSFACTAPTTYSASTEQIVKANVTWVPPGCPENVHSEGTLVPTQNCSSACSHRVPEYNLLLPAYNSSPSFRKPTWHQLSCEPDNENDRALNNAVTNPVYEQLTLNALLSNSNKSLPSTPHLLPNSASVNIPVNTDASRILNYPVSNIQSGRLTESPIATVNSFHSARSYASPMSQNLRPPSMSASPNATVYHARQYPAQNIQDDRSVRSSLPHYPPSTAAFNSTLVNTSLSLAPTVSPRATVIASRTVSQSETQRREGTSTSSNNSPRHTRPNGYVVMATDQDISSALLMLSQRCRNLDQLPQNARSNSDNYMTRIINGIFYVTDSLRSLYKSAKQFSQSAAKRFFTEHIIELKKLFQKLAAYMNLDFNKDFINYIEERFSSLTNGLLFTPYELDSIVTFQSNMLNDNINQGRNHGNENNRSSTAGSSSYNIDSACPAPILRLSFCHMKNCQLPTCVKKGLFTDSQFNTFQQQVLFYHRLTLWLNSCLNTERRLAPQQLTEIPTSASFGEVAVRTPKRNGASEKDLQQELPNSESQLDSASVEKSNTPMETNDTISNDDNASTKTNKQNIIDKKAIVVQSDPLSKEFMVDNVKNEYKKKQQSPVVDLTDKVKGVIEDVCKPNSAIGTSDIRCKSDSVKENAAKQKILETVLDNPGADSVQASTDCPIQKDTAHTLEIQLTTPDVFFSKEINWYPDDILDDKGNEIYDPLKCTQDEVQGILTIATQSPTENIVEKVPDRKMETIELKQTSTLTNEIVDKCKADHALQNVVSFAQTVAIPSSKVIEDNLLSINGRKSATPVETNVESGMNLVQNDSPQLVESPVHHVTEDVEHHLTKDDENHLTEYADDYPLEFDIVEHKVFLDHPKAFDVECGTMSSNNKSSRELLEGSADLVTELVQIEKNNQDCSLFETNFAIPMDHSAALIPGELPEASADLLRELVQVETKYGMVETDVEIPMDYFSALISGELPEASPDLVTEIVQVEKNNEDCSVVETGVAIPMDHSAAVEERNENSPEDQNLQNISDAELNSVSLITISGVQSITADEFNQLCLTEIDLCGDSDDGDDSDKSTIIQDEDSCLQCNHQSSVACELCGEAVYCSKSCQESHWEDSHYKACRRCRKIDDVVVID